VDRITAKANATAIHKDRRIKADGEDKEEEGATAALIYGPRVPPATSLNGPRVS
jgi:hypothetical protein